MSEGAWNENWDNLHFESCLQLLVINPLVLSAVNLVPCWKLLCDLLPQARDIQVLILSKCLPIGTQFGVGSQELRSVPSPWVTTVSFLPEHCGKRMGRWRQIKARPTQTLTEGCKQMFKIKTLKSNLEKQVVSLCSLVSVWVWSLVLSEGRAPDSSTSVSCECLDSQRVPFCVLKNLPEMFVPCWDLRMQRWLRCGCSRGGETVEGPSVYRHSEDFINIQSAWAPYACTWPRFQGVGHGVWGWGFSIMLGVLLLNLLYRACQGKCHVPMIRFSNWLSRISKDLPFTKSRIFF